ncbi:MAG TPA: Clp protease N-terminal domain-containing protein [Gaiellaceae bacterium]
MFERFDERARQVVVLAQDEARALRHNYIGTEHLLLGLFRVEQGIAAQVLESLDIRVEDARVAVVRIVGEGDEARAGQIPFTPRAKKVLEHALRQALSLTHNYIGTEHILLGLVHEREGVGARVLLDFGADTERIREEVVRLLPHRQRRRHPRTPSPPVAPVEPFHVPQLLKALATTKQELIGRDDFGAASRLSDLELRLERVLGAVQSELRALDYTPSLAAEGEAPSWEYSVVTLEGESLTWPEQLQALRRDGWELLTVVREGDRHSGLFERRV